MQRLSPKQERDLVIATEAGDADASRKLVAAFLPAIAGLARRFPTGAGVELRELLHEGVAGLLFAARRYDSERQTPFWAYASYWVRKRMQELVAELTRPVALSDRAVRALARLKAARGDHLLAHGVEPTSAELSRATGFTLSHLQSLQAIERRPRATEIVDTIVDPTAERAYQQVLDRIEVREVRDLADQLDERERAVIRAHFGLGEPAQTLKQIGGALGLTAERARQIEAGALDKLRDELAHPLATRS